MAAREYFYNSATAEITVTSTSFATALTLSFTPTDNQSYILIWSALQQRATGVSIDGNVILTNNATATIASYNIEPQDITTYRPVGGLAFATFATATGTHNFRIKINNETATGSQEFKEAHLMAIRLSTGDHFVNSTATQASSTATTLQTTATLSFTPSATGRYLILGSVERLGSTIQKQTMLLAVAGTGTHYGMASLSHQDGTNFTPWAHGVALDLTTSEWVTSIQFNAATGGGLQTARNRRICALRLTGGFENHFYGENRASVLVTATATTANSFSATLAFAPVATGMHAVIYGGITEPQANTLDGLTQFSGSNIDTVLANEEANLAADKLVFLGMKRWDATNTSTRTWNIGHGYETTATAGTFRKSEGFIALLQLDATATAAASTESTLRTLSLTGAGLATAGLAVLPELSRVWSQNRWAA